MTELAEDPRRVVSYDVLKRRIQRGMDYEIAAKTPLPGYFPIAEGETGNRNPSGKEKTHDGVRYPSIAALARANGLEPDLVSNRLRNNYSMK